MKEKPPHVKILFVVSFMYDPLGSLRLSFCQPRAWCRAHAGKSKAGTKRFLKKISSYGKDGWKNLHVWEQYLFPDVSSHQDSVQSSTSSHIISRMHLRSSMVPPNFRWQRCPELFICSRQISHDSSESGIHTAPWVRSCSGRCEIELPDSEQVRVSDTRHNLLDRFYRSLAVHS